MSAASEAVLTMRPKIGPPAALLAALKCTPAAWQSAAWPLRWTSMTLSHLSSVRLKIIVSRTIPALLTTISSPPNVSTAASTSSSPVFHALMSDSTASAPEPNARTSSATAVAPSPRSLTTTSAPSSARRRASARPRPDPAPVTIAVRPLRSVSGFISGSPSIRDRLIRDKLSYALPKTIIDSSFGLQAFRLPDRSTMKESIAIGDELTELAEVLDDFCTERVSPDHIHAYIDAEDPGLPDFFSDLVGIGVLDLHLDEQQGGAGVGFMGLATAAEAMGRGLVPGPALPAMITSAVLRHAGSAPPDEDAAGGPGTGLGAISLDPGELLFDSAAATLTGTSAPIPSAATAAHAVLPVDDGGFRRWVLLHTSAAETLPCPSHDVTRPMARLRIDQAVPVEILDIDPELPELIAAAALAAEGSGIAQWCTDTAVEYARVREQFGAVIGSFQAVKHRIAGMHVAAAQVRALAWDAARCLDSDVSAEERRLVISAAAGTGVDLVLDTVKDLINTLGGIGFTWE